MRRAIGLVGDDLHLPRQVPRTGSTELVEAARHHRDALAACPCESPAPARQTGRMRASARAPIDHLLERRRTPSRASARCRPRGGSRHAIEGRIDLPVDAWSHRSQQTRSSMSSSSWSRCRRSRARVPLESIHAFVYRRVSHIACAFRQYAQRGEVNSGTGRWGLSRADVVCAGRPVRPAEVTHGARPAARERATRYKFLVAETRSPSCTGCRWRSRPRRNALARAAQGRATRSAPRRSPSSRRPSVAARGRSRFARRNRKESICLLDARPPCPHGPARGAREGDPAEARAGAPRPRAGHPRPRRARPAATSRAERGTATRLLASVERTLRPRSIDEEQRLAPPVASSTRSRRPASTASPAWRFSPLRRQQAKAQRRAGKRGRGASERPGRRGAGEPGAAREREREARERMREAERERAAKVHERATADLAAAREALETASSGVEEAADRLEAER